MKRTAKPLKIEQNISRLRYLLSLYKMTEEELLSMISEGLKTPLSREEVFADEINLSHLKRIDKVFHKGLHFYLDPKSPRPDRDASIFFRKSVFGTDLNIGAKKIVNQFEEFKISLSALTKLAEIKIDRTLTTFSIDQDPRQAANQLKEILYPEFNTAPKEFLKALIAKFAEVNILVFEFVETWNKKEKANIDGVFLSPNVIVLKRYQHSFRREIFTLIHELGHYLLNEEEVEQIDISDIANARLTRVERWCNDFAYYFLIGQYDRKIDGIRNADGSNDYEHELIESISKETHLSRLALFTRLLFEKKISPANYNLVKADLEEQYRKRQEEEQKQRELEKLEGKQGGMAPKPINSPLLVSTIQTAFYGGLINEYDVCKTLNISPDKLDRCLQ